MDAREARKYVMNNPPVDPVLAERRPSLLGRLFRRSSSLSESETMNVTVAASIPIMKSQPNQPGQTQVVRRDSISEAVQAQFGTPPNLQQIRPNPVIDHEFGIYT